MNSKDIFLLVMAEMLKHKTSQTIEANDEMGAILGVSTLEIATIHAVTKALIFLTVNNWVSDSWQWKWTTVFRKHKFCPLKIEGRVLGEGNFQQQGNGSPAVDVYPAPAGFDRLRC